MLAFFEHYRYREAFENNVGIIGQIRSIIGKISVFSLLSNSFGDQQISSLEETIETSILLQYNYRKVIQVKLLSLIAIL